MVKATVAMPILRNVKRLRLRSPLLRLTATGTTPVSVKYSGNVKKPKDVTDRRYGLRSLNRLTYFLYYERDFKS
jgi:hypothetical protein